MQALIVLLLQSADAATGWSWCVHDVTLKNESEHAVAWAIKATDVVNFQVEPRGSVLGAKVRLFHLILGAVGLKKFAFFLSATLLLVSPIHYHETWTFRCPKG